MSNFFRDLFRPSDPYILFENYYSDSMRDRQTPSIEGFTAYAISKKEKQKALALFSNVFGWIGFPLVRQVCVKKIHAAPAGSSSQGMAIFSIYAESMEVLIRDFFIALQYNLEDIQSNKVVVPSLPLSAEYSWRGQQQASISSSIPMDHIYDRMEKFFLMHPFPNQLKKILGLSSCEKIKNALDKQHIELQRAVENLFSFRPTTVVINTKMQAILLRNGAVVNRSLIPRSWIHQVDKWASTYSGSGRIRDPRAHLNLGRLVLALEKSIAEPSPTDQTASCSSSSSVLDIRAAKHHAHTLGSFRTYLITKTIERIFSISQKDFNDHRNNFTKDEYEKIFNVFFMPLSTFFENNESLRLDFVFFSALINSLFLRPKKEPYPKLWEIIDSFLPLHDRRNPYERIVELEYLIFPKPERETLIYIEMLLGEFILRNYVVGESLSIVGRARLLIWLYEWRTFSSRGTADFWELVLLDKLPKGYLNEFFYAAQIERSSEKDFVCLFDLLCLYSKDPNLDLIAGCFVSIGFKLHFQSIKTLEAAGSIKQSNHTLAQILLAEHHIERDHPRYDFIDALIHLLNYQEVMELSESAQEYLFERILAINAEDRMNCLGEIGRFASAIHYLSPDPLVGRKELLKRACERRALNNSSSQTHCLDGYNDLSDCADFQLQVICDVEELIDSPIPLGTIIIVLLYCPYIPLGIDHDHISPHLLIQKIDEMKRLKNSQILSKTKSVFFDPNLLLQIDELIVSFQDPEFLMSTGLYQSRGHAPSIDLVFSSLTAVTQQVLLPSIFFKDALLSLSEPFFLSPESVLLHPDQNRIQHSGGGSFNNDFYLGEWRMMLYMFKWSLMDSKPKNDRLPALEIVLWRSLYDLKSEKRIFKLDLSPKMLSEELFSLFSCMFEHLINCPVSYAEKVNSLNDEEEELACCLEIYYYFNEEWQRFLSAEKGGESVARKLFSFFREIKIEIQNMHASLFKSRSPLEFSGHCSSIPHIIAYDEDISTSSDDDRSYPNALNNNFSFPVSSSSTLPVLSSSTFSVSPTIQGTSTDHYRSLTATREVISILQERLTNICEECRSLEHFHRFSIIEGEGVIANGKLDLWFFPTGYHQQNFGSVVLPLEGEQKPNEFIAELFIKGKRYAYELKLAEFLHHPKAPLLLNWLIETVQRLPVEGVDD